MAHEESSKLRWVKFCRSFQSFSLVFNRVTLDLTLEYGTDPDPEVADPILIRIHYTTDTRQFQK